MVYCIDNSFSASFIFPDEQDAKVVAFFRNLNPEDTLIVPHIWWYELANVLRTGVKRNRLTAAEANEALENLLVYNFTTDSARGGPYAKRVLSLALANDLSAYDAAYLELALRRGAILGTLDDGLIRAAASTGVPLAI
jgi:predicted nucleic acid-binding protein